MGNAVRGAPPAEPAAGSTSKPSSGPPPAPKRRSEEPPAPDAADAAALNASNDRRAEYVPAAPRVAMEFPKIPKLDLPDAPHVGGSSGSVPPPAVAMSAPPARSGSVPPAPPGPRGALTTPPARHAPTQRAANSVGAFTRLGESLRTRLPVALQERIEGIPAVGLIIGGGAFTLLLLAGAGLTARTVYRAVSGTSVSGTAVSGSADSSPAEASDVATLGPATPAATETKEQPSTKTAKSSDGKPVASKDEATVLLNLGDQLLSQRRDADVPALVARLIAREPARRDDPRVARILLATASSDDRKAAADSHALLTGPMGEAGATLVYELSLKRGIRDSIRTRAQTWLGSKDFEKIAPLPVYAAQRLRAAKTCEDKHDLLDFAERAGGKHVLEYLKEVEKRKACAPDDLVHCYPCMRNDTKLSDVIVALERKN